VLVSINSDAHSISDFDNLRFGVGQARRGWLEKRTCSTPARWQRWAHCWQQPGSDPSPRCLQKYSKQR